jgi:NADPH:quinone reductase-like Zn-dependent oxidoreductase
MMTRAWSFERLGGPEVLELGEREMQGPGPGEVLLKLRAIGLNRSDLLYMAGRYLTKPEGRCCLGQEALGEIVVCGDGRTSASAVAGFEPGAGSRVALLAGRVDYKNVGTYRGHGIYPSNALVPVPEPFSDAEGAAFWVGALTMVGASHVVGLGPGQGAGKNVVVTAASSAMGVAGLQIARARGARAIAVTTSPAKAESLRGLADEVVVAPKPEDIATGVRRVTANKGFDVAFDAVGHANVTPLFEAAGVEARILNYGLMAGADSPMNLAALMRKDLDIHGYTIYRNLRHPDRLKAVLDDAMDLGRRGLLRPIVAREFAFEEAKEALAAMASNRHLGKLVIRGEA